MEQRRPRQPPRDSTTCEDAQVVHDHIAFRFLDLPPELRNRIYEAATEYSYQCFPPLFPKPKKWFKQTAPPSTSDSVRTTGAERKTIPYLALTQTCAQLRAEFRPMWLATHKIPISLVTNYLKAFFPVRSPQGKHFKPLTLSTPQFRVILRSEEFYRQNWDIMRLFKHKARFPGSTIAYQSLNFYDEIALQELNQFINNSTTSWMQLIKGSKISQIRLGTLDHEFLVSIVVKERFTEPWMKSSWPPPTEHIEAFLREYGFSTSNSMLTIRVLVDYG